MAAGVDTAVGRADTADREAPVALAADTAVLEVITDRLWAGTGPLLCITVRHIWAAGEHADLIPGAVAWAV